MQKSPRSEQSANIARAEVSKCPSPALVLAPVPAPGPPDPVPTPPPPLPLPAPADEFGKFATSSLPPTLGGDMLVAGM